MSTKSILAEFLGMICPSCNQLKQKNNAFCVSCYRRLPRVLQHAVWNRFGEGFEQAFTDAKAYLTKKREMFK